VDNNEGDNNSYISLRNLRLHESQNTISLPSVTGFTYRSRYIKYIRFD